MAFGRQIWTLTCKNLLIVLGRHFFATLIKALLLPVIVVFLISYTKNFETPASDFGIGQAVPIRNLADALTSARGQHDTVAFVDHGSDGNITKIIDNLSGTVRASGYTAVVVEETQQLTSICPSSFRANTRCFAAVDFHSSIPYWNYTIHVDGALGGTIDVGSHNNDQEIYLLPIQYAIDSWIASSIGKTLPTTIEEYPFTDASNELRDMNNLHSYQGSLENILGVAFFLGMVGICYEAAGLASFERELGMSQLIEAMMPNPRRWEPQLARLVSYHLAFDMIYLPSWLITGCIMAKLVFPSSGYVILITFHILAGLALSGYSIFCAAFFRRSQLAGPTATIGSLIVAILAQLLFGELMLAKAAWPAVFALTLAFPPVLYVIFLIMLSDSQYNNRPMQLLHFASAGLPIPPLAIWALFIVQIFAFPALAAIVERARHDKPSVERTLDGIQNDDYAQIAIRLMDFNKIYKPSLIDRGQVAVLVGANGSGKTSTLKAIAGLHPVTSGIVQIDGRGGLGLCPQHNILWDELTVYEHVKIFNDLKSMDCTSKDFNEQELIIACDLVNKSNARSRILSGGQKRKLQLAMMLAGGSRVCCIDEVSSGLDPLARRKIWEIILAERGRRTILLSTHYLDEADILSDHIAILSQGLLKTEGSAAELKTRLGKHLVIVNRENFVTPFPFIDIPKQVDHDHTVYQFEDLHRASLFCTALEHTGVDDYRIQGPNIEDVFLRMADEIKGNHGGAIFAERGRSMLVDAESSQPMSEDEDGVRMNEGDEDVEDDGDAMAFSSSSRTTFFQQVEILFQKRLTILSHEYMAYLAAMVIPIIAGALVTRFLIAQRQAVSAIACTANAEYYTENDSVDLRLPGAFLDLVYGPPGLAHTLSSLYPDLNFSEYSTINTLSELNTFIAFNYSDTTSGLFVGEGDQSTIAYLGDADMSSSMFTLNLLDNVLLNTTIATSFETFSLEFDPGVNKSLQFVIFFGLAMTVYPAFLALYPSAERLRNVRSVQYSNGVRSAPLWLAYLLFDCILIILVSVIVFALFAGLWHSWYNLGYLFAVFLLYGLASAAFSYVVSIFAHSHLIAFAFSAGIQAVCMCLYFAVFICMVTYSTAETLDHNILVAHFTVALISPSANLLRALLLTLNVYRVTCQETGLAEDPGRITVYGGPILYLTLQGVAMMVFVAWWDSGGRPPRLFDFRASQHVCDEEKDASKEDTALRIEIQRVKNTEDLALRVLHVTKQFGSQKAVDNITFGIQQGECFALLGPNAAGKTTTVSLIRGDVKPSRTGGSILVNGVSVTSNPTAARQYLGVCPQFDAIDDMTVLQHLLFYGKAKGVRDYKTDVHKVMKVVGIVHLAKRMAPTLSGGNKRKLSLAIALMGNPAVLLLDEVSSGMDAAAKRVIWRILARIAKTRAVLITTHSMEEADALADRAGILAKQMLAIGTADELRQRHGDAHNIHLVHRSAPRTSNREMKEMKDWVGRQLPSAQIEDKTYHGQLRFSVANDYQIAPSPAASVHGDVTMGMVSAAASPIQDNTTTSLAQPAHHKHTTHDLINLIESHKDQLGIVYYSVSPTTLDQAFMNVVTAHNVQEENNHVDKARKIPRWRWLAARMRSDPASKRPEQRVRAVREREDGDGGSVV